MTRRISHILTVITLISTEKTNCNQLNTWSFISILRKNWFKMDFQQAKSFKIKKSHRIWINFFYDYRTTIKARIRLPSNHRTVRGPSVRMVLPETQVFVFPSVDSVYPDSVVAVNPPRLVIPASENERIPPEKSLDPAGTGPYCLTWVFTI